MKLSLIPSQSNSPNDKEQSHSFSKSSFKKLINVKSDVSTNKTVITNTSKMFARLSWEVYLLASSSKT